MVSVLGPALGERSDLPKGLYSLVSISSSKLEPHTDSLLRLDSITICFKSFFFSFLKFLFKMACLYHNIICIMIYNVSLPTFFFFC